MTYLTAAEVKSIVHLSALQIRLFLGTANPAEFTEEAKEAIMDFLRNPIEFSDETLVHKGANVEEAHKYSVRIELRGINAQGAAQVVAKGIWGKARENTIAALRKELERHSQSIVVRTAGSSSFEFNREGVDKALPIRYVGASWKNILDQMSYVPGQAIDSRRKPTLIAADGDGTIYEGPKTTHLPLLKDSPVFAPLTACLRAGAVFMLVSGNDLTRTFKRLIDGLPRELYSRVLVAANGGADLMCINGDGKPVIIMDYRHKALGMAGGTQKEPLDIVYIGDDNSPDGNDSAAFEAVGPKCAVLVKSLTDTQLFLEKWMHERKINPS
jgi:hydroxymethylpyrimidine pyrophosphatase-like HAD family hydrolase